MGIYRQGHIRAFPGHRILIKHVDNFMSNNLEEQITIVENEFKNFFNDLKNSEEYYLMSKKLKDKLIYLIIDAWRKNDKSSIDKLLKLLFDNSGSHIDLQILQEITPPLFAQGILTNDLFNEYLLKSPLSRWL